MINLYVNKVEVGNYTPLHRKWNLNLKQEVRVNNEITVYKEMYYLREFADFFTFYVYEDSEKMISDLYIIDSRDIDYEIELNVNIKEYHAIKITEDIEWRDLAVKMILED